MFQKTDEDIFEIKSKITDVEERYKYCRSFQPIFSDDDKFIGFIINDNAIKEKEPEEYEAGIFLPTSEKLNAFIGRLIDNTDF